MESNGYVEKLAELAVRTGANVQPGQIVAVGSEPGKEYMTRAVAAEAYRAGAKFVDVQWFDPHVKRARVEFAADDTLEFVPEWYGHRMLALSDEHAARVAFSGPATPGLMADLDPVRLGRDRLPQLKESSQVLEAQTTNWTIVPCPSQAWAELVYPDLEPEAALAKLWEAIVRVCRLDEPDPAKAWEERLEQIGRAGATMTARDFDALHYEGPGTDLTIGLLPGSQWLSGGMHTIDGVFHQANLPTEEVFTSPDPERTEGVVSSTMPLVLIDGTIVRDLKMRFEGGRAVEVTASSGQDTMRTIVAKDDGSARLGEAALVDNEGRIGALETVFYDTLLDENARSHIAIGQGFPSVNEQHAGQINKSEVHLDFMIGSPDLNITGITRDGERVPVLFGGDWQL